jgi:hypothetical protein
MQCERKASDFDNCLLPLYSITNNHKKQQHCVNTHKNSYKSTKKEVRQMQNTIKNPAGKTVCEVALDAKKFVIQKDGFRTTVYFNAKGELKVEHAKATA